MNFFYGWLAQAPYQLYSFLGLEIAELGCTALRQATSEIWRLFELYAHTHKILKPKRDFKNTFMHAQEALKTN